MTVVEKQRHAPVQAEEQGVVLGHHAQQRQARLVDGVVDGGVHAAEHFFPHPVHYQMQLPGAEPLQLHDGMLGVPQGGGVGGSHHHAPVGGGGSQQEAHAQPRRRVQQAVVKPFPDVPEELCHLFLGRRAAPAADRRRQQKQSRQVGMLHHSRRQGTAVLGHIGEIHQRPVGEAQSQVQVSEAHITVQAQHPLAGLCQRGADAGGKGRLACAALAGYHGDALSPPFHGAPPLTKICVLLYHKFLIRKAFVPQKSQIPHFILL